MAFNFFNRAPQQAPQALQASQQQPPNFAGLHGQPAPMFGQPQGQQQQQSQPPQGSPILNPNDPQGQQPQGQQQQVSPLDSFSGLWQTATNPDGTPKAAPADPWSEPLINGDPAKIMENASKHDFTRNVNPELMQKAMNGDFASMVQIINSVGQQALGLSAQLAVASVEHGGKQIRSRFDQTFASKLRDTELSQVNSNHPALSHPNAKPLLRTLTQQAAQANPNLSPAEARKMAEDYLIAMSGQLAPQQQSQQRPGQEQPQDWLNWVG